MKNPSKSLVLFIMAVILVLGSSCAQPTPETVVETVVVEKEVQVVETVEVVKEVEVPVEIEVIKEVQPIIYNSYRTNTTDERRVDELLVEMFNEENPNNPVQLTPPPT